MSGCPVSWKCAVACFGGRAVAAADVAALLAHPQVHPPAAGAQAVLAPVGRRLDDGDGVEVCAGVAHGRRG